jgi:hypothetical protein
LAGPKVARVVLQVQDEACMGTSTSKHGLLWMDNAKAVLVDLNL